MKSIKITYYNREQLSLYSHPHNPPKAPNNLQNNNGMNGVKLLQDPLDVKAQLNINRVRSENYLYKQALTQELQTNEKNKIKNYPVTVKEHNPKYNRGIRNSGNTCYINSVLQCLHKSKHFTNTFCSFYQKAKSRHNQKREFKLSPLIEDFISEMWIQSEAFNAKRIKKVIEDTNSVFKGYFQNDAIQFFISLLSVLNLQLDLPSQIKQQSHIDVQTEQRNHQQKTTEEIYKATKQQEERRCYSVADQTFTGRYQVTYHCRKCQKDYILFEKFNFHYLDICQPRSRIQPNVSLKECLLNFKNVEKLQGDNKMTCDHCRIQTDTDKFMEVYQTNQIFVVCFKRFLNGYKNKAVVDARLELDPKDVMANADKYKNKVYKLYAAILHVGGLYGGHYTATCFNYKSSKWVNYSDSYFREMQKPDFTNAYILFYELIDKQTEQVGQVGRKDTLRNEQRNGSKQKEMNFLHSQAEIKRMQSEIESKKNNTIYCLMRCLFKTVPFKDMFFKIEQKKIQRRLQQVIQPQAKSLQAYTAQKIHSILSKVLVYFNNFAKNFGLEIGYKKLMECYYQHPTQTYQLQTILTLSLSSGSIVDMLKKKYPDLLKKQRKLIQDYPLKYCTQCNLTCRYQRKQISHINNLLIIQLKCESTQTQLDFKIQQEFKHSEIFDSSNFNERNYSYSLVSVLYYDLHTHQAQVYLRHHTRNTRQQQQLVYEQNLNLNENYNWYKYDRTSIRKRQQALPLKTPLLLFYQKLRRPIDNLSMIILCFVLKQSQINRQIDQTINLKD